jgi:hypothetical protein
MPLPLTLTGDSGGPSGWDELIDPDSCELPDTVRPVFKRFVLLGPYSSSSRARFRPTFGPLSDLFIIFDVFFPPLTDRFVGFDVATFTLFPNTTLVGLERGCEEVWEEVVAEVDA